MITKECEKCGDEKKETKIHATGYHRSSDAKAGDPMTPLAYLCEECIIEVFGEFVDIENDYIPKRKD